MILGRFYSVAGRYFLNTQLDRSQGLFLHKALELSKWHQQHKIQSDILINIARQYILDGDYPTAQAYLTEGHRAAHLSANLLQEARCVQIGAMCSSHTWCNFKWTISQLLRQEVLLIYQNTSPYLFSLINIALIDIEIGTDVEEVSQRLNQAKDIVKKYCSPSTIAYCNVAQATLDLREKKFDIAKDEFQKGGKQTVRAWPTSDWPARWPVIYCVYAYKSRDRLGAHKALLFLGDVFVVHKDEETATNLYMVALEGFAYMDVHRSRAECMIRLRDLAEGQGHTSEAIYHWKAARPLFEQSLQVKDVAHIDAKLLAVEKAQQKAFPELVNLHAPVYLVNQEISGIEVDKGVEDPEDNPFWLQWNEIPLCLPFST
ncbi:hypothetical protein B0H14DRAFT_2603938 [Mycena olivaceomarginata]|nr:hypothetical protein B0H14DRAFT_2603938 [Mycena olivaceomarginata]